MPECNIFDIDLELAEQENRKLMWRVYTDLPCGTVLSYSCDRTYIDYEGAVCLWTLDHGAVEVSPTARGDLNGGSGEVQIDHGDQSALEEFNELLGSYSKGIKTPVGDELRVSFVLGARQPLRAFGKSNIRLSGAMVREAGGINVVESEAVISAPIQHRYQPVEWKRRME